jgi:hypothetical protein
VEMALREMAENEKEGWPSFFYSLATIPKILFFRNSWKPGKAHFNELKYERIVLKKILDTDVLMW